MRLVALRVMLVLLGGLGLGELRAQDVDPRSGDGSAGTQVPVSDEARGMQAGDSGAGDVALLPDAASVSRARASAIVFLLGEQHEDGTWGGPVFSPASKHRAWTAATTGLCVEALLDPILDAPRASPARQAWMRGVRAMLSLAVEELPTSFAVWSDAYILSACCAILSAPPQPGIEPAALRRVATLLVERLARTRGADGAWGAGDAFERDELKPDGTPRGPFAFRTGQTHVTAVVLLALAAADELGIDGTAVPLGTGRSALRRSRLPSGIFTHRVALLPGPGHREGIDEFPAALARTQVATLALLDAVPFGTTREDLLTALDTFYQHHAALDVMIDRKVSAVSGQSAYVYLFGHYYAALALDELVAAERALYERRLARDVLAVAHRNGAFFDHPLQGFGTTVGTAFGLLALQHLDGERRVQAPQK